MQHPAKLKTLLAPLERYTGRERWKEWMGLIDASSWDEFVQVLLEDHYDPKYQKSQRKHADKYSPVSIPVPLASKSDLHLDEVTLNPKP